MKVITKKGVNTTIFEADPQATYFIAKYSDKLVKGTGLDVSGWDNLDDGIVMLCYVLSTGKVITIPRYKAYMHLIEVSESIDKEFRAKGKNYHNVYIKGLTDDDIVVHKIALRGENIQDIGRVTIYKEPKENKGVYKNSWKLGDS